MQKDKCSVKTAQESLDFDMAEDPNTPGPKFKALLIKKIQALRPYVVIEEAKKQFRGYRFKSDEFVFEKIVGSVNYLKQEMPGAFSKEDLPTDFLPDSVKAGYYDKIIIDMLVTCAMGDFHAERSGRLHQDFMDTDDVKVGDLLETPDYIGRVISDDGEYIRIRILQVKTDGFEALRSPDHKYNEDQVYKGSDYFKEVKLLNVNWKDWIKLNGILND